jgi:hypothetical protein
MSVNHRPIAIAMIIFALSQTAILQNFRKRLAEG